MGIRFHLKNGKIFELVIDNVQVHRAIIFVPEDDKENAAKGAIMITDNVELLECLDDKGEVCAISEDK